MRHADLHLHTYHSDGTRSPRDVIDTALSHGIEIIAISDHDNLAAFFEIKTYADQRGATLIPAIELSCEVNGVDVHILAYAFDPLDPRIDRRLGEFRETRLKRGFRMVERLRQLGMPIDTARVEQLSGGGSMGRPHVARALVEAGHATTVADAFDRWIGAGKPAYIEKERFAIHEAVKLIRDCGGVTSVAHPAIYPDHRRLVADVLDAGVDGVEVLHPEVDEESRDFYMAMAKAKGKMTTGGSDDHGTVKTCLTLGTIKVPEEWIGVILERL